uniref:TLC domain-containing protein n=1 Tax=Haptolina brevifila TaxID=156173 RepID=A0A7S2GT77_9EUKA
MERPTFDWSQTVPAGLTALGAQCALTALFAYGPKGPWKEEPGYSAQRAVLIPTMAFLFCVGVQGWWFPGDETVARMATAQGRVFEPNAFGIGLCHHLLGVLLIWEMPTALFIKSLRDPLMFVHHIGMAAIAYGCAKHAIFGYHSLFFGGIVEVTSVPLAITKLFHPDHRAWAACEARSSSLQKINLASRISFALSFFVVRCLAFPYVLFHVGHDLRSLWSLPLEERHGFTYVHFSCFYIAGILFYLLQLHWGRIVLHQAIKQVRRILQPNSTPAAASRKNQ